MSHARSTRRALVAATLLLAAHAHADDAPALQHALTLSPPPGETAESLPKAVATINGTADEPPAPTRAAFGDAGTSWLKVGGGVASLLKSETATAVSFGYSYFLVKDVEIGLELDGWYFQQHGDNAGGLNPNFILHWHFINTGKWTTFAEVGIGFLVANDNVPEGGTRFDLMPRAGFGVTRSLTDNLRLEAGIRWHHVSNARIEGDHHNPSRDLPMLYAQLIFPF